MRGLRAIVAAYADLRAGNSRSERKITDTSLNVVNKIDKIVWLVFEDASEKGVIGARPLLAPLAGRWTKHRTELKAYIGAEQIRRFIYNSLASTTRPAAPSRYLRSRQICTHSPFESEEAMGKSATLFTSSVTSNTSIISEGCAVRLFPTWNWV